jgi:hypothetical protein
MSYKALRTMLTESAAVTSLVGDRVYPQRRGRASGSSVVISLIDGQPQVHSRGVLGLDRRRYQLTCLAGTYEAAAALAEAVKSAIHGIQGRYGGTFVNSCTVVDEGDIPSIDPEIEQQTEYGVRIDAEMWFNTSPSTF